MQKPSPAGWLFAFYIAYSCSVLYRLYRSDDFSQLYAIEQTCFQPPLRYSSRYMHKLIDSLSSATWIAEEDARMTGFAVAGWSLESNRAIAYIHTLEVAPGERRRGIARELLRRVEGSAIDAGAEAIWLHVDEANTAAIRLYEGHGYLVQGREADFYAKGIPALVYGKSLA
jgi:ribosomal protein S18 acetylase RimI-like enzyme